MITQSQYDQAYLDTMANGKTMPFFLVENRAVTSNVLSAFLSKTFGLKQKKITDTDIIDNQIIKKLPSQFVKARRVIPVSAVGDAIELGITDPADKRTMDEASRLIGRPVIPVLLSEKDMTFLIEKYYIEGNKTTASYNNHLFFTDESSSGFHTHPDDNWDDDSERRDTVSFGFSIEDALASVSNSEISKHMKTNTLKMSAPKVEEIDSPPPQTQPVHKQTISTVKNSIKMMPPVIIEPKIEPVVPVDPEVNSTINRWNDTGAAALISQMSSPKNIKHQRNSLFPNRAARSSNPSGAGSDRTDGEILHAIATTQSRDEIIALALEYLLRFSKRAVFMVNSNNKIRGFHVAGTNTNRESIKAFWIPFFARSTLGTVAQTGQMHLGPVGNTPADKIFKAALGGDKGNTLMIPIVIKTKTAGILYADQLDVPQIAWPRLTRLLEAVSSSLSIIFFKNRA
ncbi:MAG: hypothetical protein JXR91_17205 [Deltaproteobacteria bacterium]|nr:hypothetical protein [Deltaproteobacteria bacterium]